MSSGQKPRTPEHFPRMKDRAGRRRRRQVQRYRHFRQRWMPGAGLEQIASFAIASGAAFESMRLGLEGFADELSKLPPVGVPTAADLERLQDWHEKGAANEPWMVVRE